MTPERRGALALTLLLGCAPASPAVGDAPSGDGASEAVDTCDTSEDVWPTTPEADAGCVVQHLCCEYVCWTDAEYAEYAAEPYGCDVECCEPPSARGRCAWEPSTETCAFED